MESVRVAAAAVVYLCIGKLYLHHRQPDDDINQLNITKAPPSIIVARLVCEPNNSIYNSINTSNALDFNEHFTISSSNKCSDIFTKGSSTIINTCNTLDFNEHFTISTINKCSDIFTKVQYGL